MEVLEIHKHWQLLDQCCDLINSEWPRSKTARLRSLHLSCDSLPTNLVLLLEGTVIGHSKMSVIPSLPMACFIESVVIQIKHRGQGLGFHLMMKSEEYAKERGINTIYLSTTDKQNFYSKLDYKVCDPISIYGCSTSMYKATPVDDTIVQIEPMPPSEPKISSPLAVPPPPPMPLFSSLTCKPTSIKTSKTYMKKEL